MMYVNLNRRISIDYQTTTQDPDSGRDIVSWERLVLCPAEVQDAMPSRSEGIRQGIVTARNQTRVRIRWRDDVTSAMRIVIHGDSDRVVGIISGRPAEIGGRKRYLEMMCEEIST